MRWPPIGNTGGPCRWMRRWPGRGPTRARASIRAWSRFCSAATSSWRSWRMRSLQAPPAKLSKDIKVERRLAPAAGFAETQRRRLRHVPAGRDFLASIAAARQEVQALFEFSHDLGTFAQPRRNALGGGRATEAAGAVRFHRDLSGARTTTLIPEFVSGDDFRLFSSLEDSAGAGIVRLGGAEPQAHRQRQPSVEPGYLNDPRRSQHAALGPGGSAGGSVDRRLGSAGAVPSRARRFLQGPSAHSAGDQLEDWRFHRERHEVPGWPKTRRPPTI